MNVRGVRFLIAVCCLAGAAETGNAASLFDYNVVVTGTLTESSHIQGRTFVNNLSTSDQPDFARGVTAGTGDTLSVAGAVNGSGLTMDRGTFRHAGALPRNFQMNLNGGSRSVMDPGVSIASLSNQLNATASTFDAYRTTPVTASGGNLRISALENCTNVFSTSAAELSRQNESISVSVNASLANSVIIKVLGATFTFDPSEHEIVNGSAQKVIWYFPNARTITLNGSMWAGSILAPFARLVAPNQTIDGGVYVKDFVQTAEVHLPGNLTPVVVGPPVPAPRATDGLAAAGVGAVGIWFARRRKSPRL